MTQDPKSSDVLPKVPFCRVGDISRSIAGLMGADADDPLFTADHVREAVALALAAQKAAPAGWKLVPINPTQEMIDAAEAINPEDHWVKLPDDFFGNHQRQRDVDSVLHYRAMLNAAPSTPPSEAEQAEAPAFNLDPTPISGWGQQPIGMSTTLAKCPACHGTGAIGIPGAPCPFCKIHELGNLTGKIEQAEAPSERVTAGGGFVGDRNGVLTARIKELEGIIEKLTDSECDKIMAMTDAQISALHRMEGHDPEDIAKLGQLTARLAIRDVQVAQLRATPPAASKAEPVAPVVQEWRLVPVKPTEQMIAYAVEEVSGVHAEMVWSAMLEAAPAQQPEASGAGERQTDLSDEKMDTVVTAIAKLNSGDMGFNEFVDYCAALATKPPAGEQKPVEGAK